MDQPHRPERDAALAANRPRVQVAAMQAKFGSLECCTSTSDGLSRARRRAAEHRRHRCGPGRELGCDPTRRSSTVRGRSHPVVRRDVAGLRSTRVPPVRVEMNLEGPQRAAAPCRRTGRLRRRLETYPRYLPRDGRRQRGVRLVPGDLAARQLGFCTSRAPTPSTGSASTDTYAIPIRRRRPRLSRCCSVPSTPSLSTRGSPSWSARPAPCPERRPSTCRASRCSSPRRIRR